MLILSKYYGGHIESSEILSLKRRYFIAQLTTWTFYTSLERNQVPHLEQKRDY
jgi:hypothetical protein